MLKPIKGQPGRFLETGSGQVLNISEYREDDKFDTIVIHSEEEDPTEIIYAGKQFIFFRDLVGKLPYDTNFTQPSRLSMGEEMILDRVGATVEQFMGSSAVANRDMTQVIYNGHLRVNVNNILLVAGPLIKFAPGYGITGSGLYTSADLVTATGIYFNIGIPSPAAVPKLVRTQTLTDKHEIVGYLTFFSRAWMDTKLGGGFTVGMPEMESSEFVPVKCWLHGLLKVASTK